MICALLFFCTTINYIDRNSLSVLKTTLQGALGWTDVDYGWITFAFTFAYAAFPSLIGVFVDRFGVKKALAGALVLWSLAAAAHGLVATVLGFVIVRFVLGIAEAANFPASIKAVGMWFPQKERALATGIFNSGTSVGVMVSFLTVWIAGHWGWQGAFVFIGVIGLVWLYLLAEVSSTSPSTSRASARPELDYIQAGLPAAEKAVKVPWTALLRYREIWPFIIGKFITDPVWWFYLFWLPSYLERERGQNPLTSALWIGVIYTGSSIGSILGGWLSGAMIKRGWPVGKARMTTMLLAAIFMPGSIFAYYADSFGACVAFITLATACHQAWSANLFTNATDMFPRQGGRVGGRPRRHRRRHRRHVHDFVSRARRAVDRQSADRLRLGRWHAPAGAGAVLVLVQGTFRAGQRRRGSRRDRRHTGACWSPVESSRHSASHCPRWCTATGRSMVAAVKATGAAQAAVVAVGFVVIGVALLYAGSSRKLTPAL